MATARAKGFVPVFNTAETPFKLPLVRKDDGRMMAMETVAFPGTLFTVKKQHGQIWEVSTAEYPSNDPLYVDSRLLENVDEPLERTKLLPPSEAILKMIKTLVGTRYFWGGNCPLGIPELSDLYEKPDQITADDRADATCTGVDCSGLLSYVTNGSTPRNTSQLIHYGTGIDIQGLTAEKICKQTKPLDLFVWRGHVLIILSTEKLIESRLEHGVVVRNSIERIEEVQKQLDDAYKPYYLRRWHPEMLT